MELSYLTCLTELSLSGNKLSGEQGYVQPTDPMIVVRLISLFFFFFFKFEPGRC